MLPILPMYGTVQMYNYQRKRNKAYQDLIKGKEKVYSSVVKSITCSQPNRPSQGKSSEFTAKDFQASTETILIFRRMVVCPVTLDSEKERPCVITS